MVDITNMLNHTYDIKQSGTTKVDLRFRFEAKNQ